MVNPMSVGVRVYPTTPMHGIGSDFIHLALISSGGSHLTPAGPVTKCDIMSDPAWQETAAVNFWPTTTGELKGSFPLTSPPPFVEFYALRLLEYYFREGAKSE